MKNEQGVLQQAAHLVSCFAQHDFDKYFECFADDAVFIFHTSNNVLRNKAEYQKEWKKWEQEWGFKVESCKSTNQLVQLFNDVAIFSHTVDTTLNTSAGKKSFTERETIVFQFQNDKWIAVHEHLSPMPE
ncbi:MAG: YybH family protein [Candidatus Nanopelagicales bacterium]